MSNRYVRIYDNPPFEAGTTIGFSASISEGALDPILHDWLGEQGYNVTVEPSSHYVADDSGPSRIFRRTYVEEPVVPNAETSVSAKHLHVEPPLKDEHLKPLAQKLGQLSSCDPYHNSGYLIDNRGTDPRISWRNEDDDTVIEANFGELIGQW